MSNYLEQYYSNYDEEGRLLLKYGQVEYITTMKYIHEFLKKSSVKESKILEVGAGTGRYSIALAKEGYKVEAIELVKHNVEIFKSKAENTSNITVSQGNALDLSRYSDNIFDMTLLLGPMYHLYNDDDKKKALGEAVRVTKKGGYILVAYCMNEASVIHECFIWNRLKEYMDKKLINDNFKLISQPEDLFELVRIEDIQRLNMNFNVERIKLIATDGATNYMRNVIEQMDDKMFSYWIKYHLSTCERQDLIGATHHSLDILRKRV
ncbi:MAG: class I SAM-dependent methyltransferase [Clostridiales bacterium]|nr:class I SAM-dependent methyltransferase [Clostridiales bacterium]